MSRDDGFLSRWSRRKVEARSTEPQPAGPGESPPATMEEPAFDLADLPDVESLTGSSDISMFLKKGVPEPLKNAALRKAWAADPAIRDYIGPADFQWDFHAAGAIGGFGDLPSGTDVARLVADVTEYHLRPPAEPPLTQDDPSGAGLPAPEQVVLATPEAAAPPLRDDEDERAEGTPDVSPAPAPGRRRHGSALPR